MAGVLLLGSGKGGRGYRRDAEGAEECGEEAHGMILARKIGERGRREFQISDLMRSQRVKERHMKKWKLSKLLWTHEY